MKKNCIIIIIVFLCSSCSLFQRPLPSVVGYLPRDTDVPGWVQKNRDYFTKKERIALIDRNYHVHNVAEFVLATYQSVSSVETVIQVSILKCDTPLSSFGLFSIEKNFLQVRPNKDESYFSDEGLFFREGEFYVRLATGNVSDSAKQDLIAFKDIISKTLNLVSSKQQLPEWMYAFSETKTLLDLVYFRNGHPLIPGSGELFVRRRTIQDKDVQVFFMRAATNNESSDRYRSILAAGSPQFTLHKAGKLQLALKEVDDKKYIFIANKNVWIYGILNAESVGAGGKIMVSLENELNNVM